MQNNTVILAKQVELFHENYLEEYLTSINREKPTDMLSSLRFFFGISLYQGRRDKISDRFYSILMDLLASYDLKEIAGFDYNNYKQTAECKPDLIAKYQSFINNLKSAGINKENDRVMIAHVVAISNRIWQHEKMNIIDYFVDQIINGRIEYVYNLLNNLYSIGPKISGLLLRDLVQIYELQKFITSAEDYGMLQPIDTWVHQVSREIGLVTKRRPYPQEGLDIAKFCLSNQINPIHYNEGAWYLGSQSYKIVLNQLRSNALNVPMISTKN